MSNAEAAFSQAMVFAQARMGQPSCFLLDGVTYYIDKTRRLWRFFPDAVTALGAQGQGLLDMSAGSLTAYPGVLNDRAGLWCRVADTADREVLFDYVATLHTPKDVPS